MRLLGLSVRTARVTRWGLFLVRGGAGDDHPFFVMVSRYPTPSGGGTSFRGVVCGRAKLWASSRSSASTSATPDQKRFGRGRESENGGIS